MITENTETWTTSRVLVIEYDGDGRYHERLFRRTVLDNASPVYIDPVGRKFNENLLTRRSKVCPIPDDATLYRWEWGTAPWSPQLIIFHSPITAYFVRSMNTTCSSPLSDIAYVMQDVASVTGEVSGDVQDR